MESSLHHSLKYQYTGIEGDIEPLVDSFVCDGRTTEGELIEVQIGSFSPLKKKVAALALKNKVRIIHPIIVQKYIELYDTSGCLISKRKSTKKGKEWDVFKALVYAPELPLIKKLTIELALVEIIEKRIDDGKGSWRRKGISIVNRSLVMWHDSVVLSKLKDYYRFIPFKKNEEFTVRDLMKKAGTTPGTARKTLYVLSKLGLVEKVGKRLNAVVYMAT